MAVACSDLLAVDGAKLHYRISGTGPLLLLLASGDGDAESFDALAAHLVRDFTILTYDRRGLSRSVADAPIESPRLETHTDDVHDLLAHVTEEPALVFGASIGALIGLDLIARYPDQIRCLIAHEPPAPELLSEPERTEAVRDQAAIEEAFACEGVPAAMKKFLEITNINFADRESDAKLPEPTPNRMRNLQFFLAHDTRAVRQYRLSMSALVTQSGKIIPAAGVTSADEWPHHCALKLAESLGNELRPFPGGHVGFALHPKSFAAQLREALAGFEQTHGHH
jgi:pimeloyl-ACP methyl ester carboxylesterase